MMAAGGQPWAGRYQSVAVLLVHWADQLVGNHKFSKETQALAQVFSDKYGFTTEVLVLDDARSQPVHVMNLNIANFMYKYENYPQTSLIILYYGGHAFTREKDGDDKVFISATANADREDTKCPWSSPMSLLHHARSDVLVLLDVPFAAADGIESTSGRNLRKIHVNTTANPSERDNAQTDISTDSFAPEHESRNAVPKTNRRARICHILVGTHDATSTPDSLPFTSALVASLSELCEASSTYNAKAMPFTARRLLARTKRHMPSQQGPPQYLAEDRMFIHDIYLEPLWTPENSRDQLSKFHSQEDVASESASEIDDDAASVFSEMSIASSVSSIESMGDENMTEELVQLFTYNVFHTFELASLSTAALAEPRIGSARFARNFRRLIAQFGSNAKKQGATSTQLQAARLLRSRRISARAAQLVVELIEADNLTALHDGNSEEDEAGRSLRVYSNLISDAYRIDAASSDANESDEGDDGEVDSEDDDSEQAEDEDDDSILSRGTIDQVKLFLLGSEAYALFRTQLLDFVHSPYEKRLYSALRESAIISDSGTPIPPDAKIGLVRELSWVPPTLFDFAFEVQAPRFNHLRALVEDSLGEVWDWWPLRQRVRPLKVGYCRLSWVTPCGSVRSLDIAADARRAFDVAIHTAPAFLYLTNAKKHAIAVVEQSSGTRAAANQPAASSTSPSQGSASNTPRQSTNSQHTTTPSTAPAGPTGTKTSAPDANTRASAAPPVQPDCRHVYLCVKTGSDYDYKLRAIRSDQLRRDGDFFAELRSQYLAARGWWRNTFSWWRYDHCEFYRFYKYAIERSEPRHADFPPDTDVMYDCEPSPPESRPPEGPVSPGEFRDRFYHCYACHSWHRHRRMVLFNTNDDYILKALPKRKQALEMGDGKREYFWGIYAKERRCFRWVAAYAVLANVPGLVFVFLWLFQWKHASDLQGATVLAQVSIALSIAFVGAIWADKG